MAKLRTEPAAYDLRAAITLLIDDITDGSLSDCADGGSCIATAVCDRLRHLLAMSAPHEKP